MKPKLTDVLEGMVHHEERYHIRLRRGLVLAYTPGTCNDDEPGQYKLCLSRKEGQPSPREDGIVLQALQSALKGRGREYERMILQPNVSVEANGRVVVVTYIVWWEPKQSGFPF